MGQNDAAEQDKQARQLQSRGLLSQEVESYSALPFLADDADRRLVLAEQMPIQV